tara:strand:- start:233 stop:1594 length:1362 start_codon:yes stop_codon:yes gene_type:complete
MKNIDLVIDNNAKIKNALKLLEKNAKGFILVEDESKSIIGVITDGDIRRNFLKGGKLEDNVMSCVNLDFTKGSAETPKELLLKKLDQSIKFIPILDSKNRLIRVITKNYIPINKEKNVYYRSKSPVRISFGGGGSDTSLFFLKNKGAVINTTISLFTHSILKIRRDSKIIFNSNDLNDSIQFSNIEEMINYNGKFGLIKSIIQALNPKYGFELYIDSDYPMNSGLGGSAVVASSILGCFNQLRIDKWDQYEISEIAYQAERLHLGVHGGWQDQYATVFGGLNFMEFNKKQNIINPIRLSNDIMLQLEDSLVLCYTGTTHDSGNIHLDQKKKTKEKDVNNRIIKNVELTYEMRNLLLKGKLDQFGKCLDMAWKLKRSFSSKISNKFLNNVYDEALKNGAYGGKLLGAGGGGYFLFYCPSNNRNRLINWINKSKLTYTPISFDNKGLQSWTVRNE